MPPDGAPSGKTRKFGPVLVVEDDAALALAVEDALLDAGASRVVIAASTAQATDTLRDERFETVILDVHLADRGDGWAIAELLRAQVGRLERKLREAANAFVERAKGHAPVIGDIDERLALRVEQRGFGRDATQIHGRDSVGAVEINVTSGDFPLAIDLPDLIAVHPGGQQLGLGVLGREQSQV